MNLSTILELSSNNSSWLNTEKPLTSKDLRGQTILLEFWTGSSVQCLHALNDLKQLKRSFKNQSFLIIGVHCPKYPNEKKLDNIKNTLIRYSIDFPVILDNNNELSKKYSIRSWPSYILFDAENRAQVRTSGENVFKILHKATVALLDESRRHNTLKPPLTFKSFAKPSNSILSFPGKIALDKNSQKLFISDSNNNRVLISKLDNTNAIVTDCIGSGVASNEDGVFIKANLNFPQGIAYQDNFLYICDSENHLVKQADLENRVIKTIAGNGQRGDWRTSSGNALETPLNSPVDCILKDDYLFIAMAGNHQIWKLDLANNYMEKFAGNGWENLLDGKRESAQFAQPSGLTANDYNLFITDSEASAIRKLDWRTSLVKTILGESLNGFGFIDGSVENSRLQHPKGIDLLHNRLIIADTYNNAIREINLVTKIVKTVFPADKKSVSPLNEPGDVLFLNPESILIADTNNHSIKRFDITSNKMREIKILFQNRAN